MEKMIGRLCIAANKIGLELSITQLEQLARVVCELDQADQNRVHQELVKSFLESGPITDLTPAPVEKSPISKKEKAQEPATDSKKECVVEPLAKANTIVSEDIEPANKTIEEAYMGEHVNIQPRPVEKKPLSPREQQLWDYMQNNPDARMPKICESLGISNANYYMLKVQLKKKGWIESAVENVQAIG